MKQFKLATLLLSLGGMLGTGTAILGHHSFAAEYDADQIVTLTGTVTKTASARMITLPNGERLPAASPADGGPE